MKKCFGWLFIGLLLSISGCFNPPAEVKGPKWTNTSTLPLVVRAKNTDGTSNTELRLDGQANGANEVGIDLTGNGSTTYAPGGEINLTGGTYKCLEISGISQDILGLTTGTINVPPLSIATSSFYNAVSNYAGFMTSKVIKNDSGVTVNTIDIQINNGTAGSSGLTVTLNDFGTDSRSGTISQGATRVSIPITNFNILQGVKLTFTGDLNFSTSGSITIKISKLQISTMIIKGSLFNNFPNKTITVNKTSSFDMSSLVNGSLNIKDLTLIFRTGSMPDNLKAKVSLELTANGNTNPYDLTFQNNTQSISLPFNKNYSNLLFNLKTIELSPIDESKDVTIDGTQAINFAVRPQLSLQSKIQQMSVDHIDQSTIQDVAINISAFNNSQVGVGVTVYLSPNANPTSDPNAVKLTFTVNPTTIPGVAQETVITPMHISAQNIVDLTANKIIYNQFEVQDLSTGTVQKSPYPYLEVRASATLTILVNNH